MGSDGEAIRDNEHQAEGQQRQKRSAREDLFGLELCLSEQLAPMPTRRELLVGLRQRKRLGMVIGIAVERKTLTGAFSIAGKW